MRGMQVYAGLQAWRYRRLSPAALETRKRVIIMGVFSRSYRIFKESLAVLREEKMLILFPIISGLVMILLTLGLLVPLYYLTGIKEGTVENNPLFYLFFFIFYFAGYFVIIFFNTGLIACAHLRLNGMDPSFEDGLQFALENAGKIAGWALISATVGLLLNMIRERAGLIGRIGVGIVGVAWNLITFFVIPVFVFEGSGVIQSIKKSAVLFKRTWGENVVLRFSVGLILALLGLLGILPVALAVMTGSTRVIIAASDMVAVYWMVLFILGASLNGIFAAALYNYASTGEVPSAYSPGLIENAFGPRSTGGFLR